MSSLNNCTLATCSIKQSIFEYIPSLAANSVFIALFGIAFAAHLYQGLRWKTWAFTACMLCGCAAEMAGYGGRIIMHHDPFSFGGFMLQIVCITFAPFFFSAAIYITLYKAPEYYTSPLPRHDSLHVSTITFSSPATSYLFVLQAIGGAMSTKSEGSSKSGVNIALAGLCFQVFTLSVFIILSLDYANRYRKDVQTGQIRKAHGEDRFQLFVVFLAFSILCILTRCVYRIDELSDGYHGPLIHNQGLFIGLEGVMVVVAVFALNIADPGRSLTRAQDLASGSPPTEEEGGKY